MNQFPKNSAVEQYFQSLPMNVQESIKQTGLTFRSETELRSCAEHLLSGQMPSAN